MCYGLYLLLFSISSPILSLQALARVEYKRKEFSIMPTEEDMKVIEQAQDRYFRRQWFHKNGFTLYSCIVSTLALIVSIIALIR